MDDTQGLVTDGEKIAGIQVDECVVFRTLATDCEFNAERDISHSTGWEPVLARDVPAEIRRQDRMHDMINCGAALQIPGDPYLYAARRTSDLKQDLRDWN